ncbi:MAG: sodium:solute symporter family protein [Luteolibacter sp.]
MQIIDSISFLASGALSIGESATAPKIDLHLVDYLILGVYILVVVGIGFVMKKYVKSASDFLTSGRSIPVWVTGLAFLSANLGAQEVIGMAASGAKYGIMTSHFYWVGAIPAMIFLAVFMMPFYYGSRARSVPEYLKLRFDEKTRGLNAVSFALMTVASSGASLHALAALLHLLLKWDYNVSLVVSSVVVLAYVLKGGLSSAIYTEVLQFFLIVLGFAPLVIIGLNDLGGWNGLKESLTATSGDQFVHSWKYMGSTMNPMGVEWFGMVFGLGFVLSFGYWCTDFLVVQRAMAAKTMGDARRTPIIGAIPKMLFPVIVILPGMIALGLAAKAGSNYSIPLGVTGTTDYNLVIPSLIAHYLPTGMLGLALTALMASFMSGMAGNVTAFNTVWTYDIYQSYIGKGKSDSHYMWMAKFATVAGIIISIAFAYVAKNVNNIMDFLQLVFGFVNAPVFATFLLGMFWKRTTGHGAFYGLLSGTICAMIFHGISSPQILKVGETIPGVKGAWINSHFQFTSSMAQNFWLAIVAWTFCFVITIGVSLATKRTKTDAELVGLVYSLTDKIKEEGEPLWKRPAVVGSVVLLIAVILNIIFW